jgi:hypothetical protein
MIDLLLRVFLCGRDKTPRVTVVRGYDDFGRRAAKERREKREETS